MRQIVQDYLEKPNSKLFDAMTSEEQRWVDKQANPKKAKASKPKAAPPKEENADS